jgi:hypothetical protein
MTGDLSVPVVLKIGFLHPEYKCALVVSKPDALRLGASG